MRRKTLIATGALLLATTLTTAGGVAGSASARQAGPRADVVAPTLTIDVITGKHSTTMTTTQFAPGNTVFDTTGKGTVEVVSLASGYSVKNLFKDAKKLFSGDVKVVRRVDRHVTFWGGTDTKGDAQFAMNLPAGSYYMANVDHNTYVPFTVVGTPESRALPEAGGTVKMVGDMTFHADSHLPDKGWIQVENKASEPHFVVFSNVAKGTKKSTIRTFLLAGAQGRPSWGRQESHDVGVVSPGHTFVASIDASKGEYAELCFWPSKRTGMPHALMGMFDLSRLG